MTERAYTVLADHPVDSDDGELVPPGGSFVANGSERLRQMAADGLIVPDNDTSSSSSSKETTS